MWVVLGLAAMVLVLARTMRVEAITSANETARLQADAVEQGAIQYVLAHVDSLAGNMPDANTPCEAVALGQGKFWIIKPNPADDHTYNYGIADEGAKVNLNTASGDMLVRLARMPGELAASIVDWRDADSTTSSGGAENDYYLALAEPYQCKNAALESVEELLLIKGGTAQALYGEDTNRNGMLDANEDDADQCDPSDNHDGHLDRGIAPFVTVYSVESNKDAAGKDRVNVNQATIPTLGTVLGNSLGAARVGAVLDQIRRNRPFTNILDFQARSGLTTAEFAQLANGLTTAPAGDIRGLINVNTAPKEVLAALPGLEDSDVSALLAKRAASGTDLTNIAWVIDALTPAKARGIGGLITVRSYQFSADILSVSGDGRAFRRCCIVVDARTSPPKVVYRQDLTQLGWPLAAQTLTDLRSGTSTDKLSPKDLLKEALH